MVGMPKMRSQARTYPYLWKPARQVAEVSSAVTLSQTRLAAHRSGIQLPPTHLFNPWGYLYISQAAKSM